MIIFGALAVICLLAVVIAGRLDYLFLAAVCAVSALVSRNEMKKEKE